MAKFEAKQLLKEKKFWFASILIAWVAALQGKCSYYSLSCNWKMSGPKHKPSAFDGNREQSGRLVGSGGSEIDSEWRSVNSSSNDGNSSGADCLQSTATLRHNSGISLDWTPEEQSTLEKLLPKYASDPKLVRYAKISMQLKDKTVWDVALRCKWMNDSSVVEPVRIHNVAEENKGALRKSRGEEDEAFQILEYQAQKGNARAMYKIGLFYYFGLRGLRSDRAKALSWFSKAVDKGEAQSMEFLGEIYARGAGVERNYTKALEWLTLAANQQLYSAYKFLIQI